MSTVKTEKPHRFRAVLPWAQTHQRFSPVLTADTINAQVKHTCQYVGGFLASTEEDESPGSRVTLTAMAAEDVAECADLFLAAHGRDCGWDRRADIELSLCSGYPFPM